MIYLHTLSVPLFGSDHRPEFILRISEDVTARRDAVRALQSSERRLRTIADRTPALIAFIDRQEVYRFTNAAFERAFGVTHEGVLGKTIREVIGDAFPEMPGTNLVGDANPGATVLLRHPTLKTASGEPMPVLALGEYGTGRTIALTVDDGAARPRPPVLSAVLRHLGVEALQLFAELGDVLFRDPFDARELTLQLGGLLPLEFLLVATEPHREVGDEGDDQK